MWIPVVLEDIFRKGSCWGSGGQGHTLHLNRNGSSMEMCMCVHVACVHVCLYARVWARTRVHAHACVLIKPHAQEPPIDNI